MMKKAGKILLVDDFEIVRRVIRDSLEKIGLTTIEEADDGLKAMAMLNSALQSGTPYSIVFCDWNMPGMTGLEVLIECRKSESFKTLPFVMVTAESEQDAMIAAIQAGATDYIIKPVTADVLQRKALRILAKLESAA